MTNWANIGNAFQKLGSGLMQTAVTSYVLRNSTNCCGGSIFGMGAGCFGGGMGFGMPSMFNPMSNPLGLGVFSPTNMFNTMNTQYGNALAAQWGYLDAQKIKANSQNSMYPNIYNTINTMQKASYDFAGAVDKDQDTTKGKALNEATNQMLDDEGKAVEDKAFTISENNDTYKDDVKEYGKSFLAEIDNSNGNKDGEISIDEFVNYELNHSLKSNADSDEKAVAMQKAQAAFGKLDQNKDNKIDWKEMSAAVATFDTDKDKEAKGGEGALDGKITSEDFAHWSTEMTNSASNTFDKTFMNNYNFLFGKEKKEEE